MILQEKPLLKVFVQRLILNITKKALNLLNAVIIQAITMVIIVATANTIMAIAAKPTVNLLQLKVVIIRQQKQPVARSLQLKPKLRIQLEKLPIAMNNNR